MYLYVFWYNYLTITGTYSGSLYCTEFNFITTVIKTHVVTANYE